MIDEKGIKRIREKRIIWKKYKDIYSIIEEIIYNDYITIVNLPIEYLDDIFKAYYDFKIKVYDDKDDEAPLDLNLYSIDYNYIHQNKKIRYIDINKIDFEIEIYIK